MRVAVSIGLVIAVFSILNNAVANEYNSDVVFERFKDRIFQIRVINKASGNKSVIGSGFQISTDGHVATNYHVITEYIHEPERYRIEYLDQSNAKGSLVVKAIDVIHDLAILQYKVGDKSGDSSHLLLEPTLPSKGTALYSIGNPHDLGMTVVGGVHNGLVEKSFYQRILFSGSINSGMSGGPTFNGSGKVIGVNVATAGNQLSFLVPARYLITLFAKALNDPITKIELVHSRIQQQLLDNQQALYSSFLGEPWPKDTIGGVITPGAVANFFKCWGDSTEKEDDTLYTLIYKACDIEQNVFLNGQFDTGGIHYRYQWIESNDMTPWQFFNHYSNAYSGINPINSARKQDVSEYRCNVDFVEVKQHLWKSNFCIRKYEKYPLFYDLVYNAAVLEGNSTGLVFSLVASGVTQRTSLKLIERFMGELDWKE